MDYVCTCTLLLGVETLSSLIRLSDHVKYSTNHESLSEKKHSVIYNRMFRNGQVEFACYFFCIRDRKLNLRLPKLCDIIIEEGLRNEQI